jgi:hypothetical protein
MLSAKKARQRPLIVSGGDRILSDIEKLIFTIVRFGMFEVKYQPKVDQCSLGADSVPSAFSFPEGGICSRPIDTLPVHY